VRVPWGADQHGRTRPLDDNIFVERPRRSVKCEEVYLKRDARIFSKPAGN
jgi:hypothetical protein